MILTKGSVLILVVLYGVCFKGAVSFRNNTTFPDLACPAWPQGYSWYTLANQTCTGNSNCSDSKLCCYDGAERHCTDPYPARLLPKKCPWEPAINVDEDYCKAVGYTIYRRCYTDDDCMPSKACCQEETCQWACVDRHFHFEHPGIQPVIIGKTVVKKNYWTGRKITLRCSGKGEGLQTITWYKINNAYILVPLRKANVVTKILRDGRRIQSQLILPNSRCGDAGEYKCFVKTEFGRGTMKSFRVYVYNGKSGSKCEARYS